MEQDSSHPTGVRGKDSPETRRARSRKANSALEMRLAGASWEDIAEVLGYPTARQALVATERALEKELKSEPSQANMRALAGRRLERLLRATWNKAINPDHPEQLAAHQRAVAVIDRHIKLYGLDAPTEMVVHSPSSTALEAWVNAVTAANVPALEEADIFGDGDDDEDIVEAEVVEDAPTA